MKEYVAYVAAPYGASTPEEVQRNIDRAVFIGKLLFRIGEGTCLPYVPHVNGTALLGREETPEIRKQALAYGIGMLRAIGAAGGAFVLLQRDDGTLSAGMEAELDVWEREFAHGQRVRRLAWERLGTLAQVAGLHAEWIALTNPPRLTPHFSMNCKLAAALAVWPELRESVETVCGVLGRIPGGFPPAKVNFFTERKSKLPHSVGRTASVVLTWETDTAFARFVCFSQIVQFSSAVPRPAAAQEGSDPYSYTDTTLDPNNPAPLISALLRVWGRPEVTP